VLNVFFVSPCTSTKIIFYVDEMILVFRSERYGDTAPECAEVFFYYGKALLELARQENEVLGNALQSGTVLNNCCLLNVKMLHLYNVYSLSFIYYLFSKAALYSIAYLICSRY